MVRSQILIHTPKLRAGGVRSFWEEELSIFLHAAIIIVLCIKINTEWLNYYLSCSTRHMSFLRPTRRCSWGCLYYAGGQTHQDRPGQWSHSWWRIHYLPSTSWTSHTTWGSRSRPDRYKIKYSVSAEKIKISETQWILKVGRYNYKQSTSNKYALHIDWC